MQGWFKRCKSINVISHINEFKDKKYIIISLDIEKAFDKNSSWLHDESPGKSMTNENIPRCNKSFSGKSTANLILCREKLETIQLTS